MHFEERDLTRIQPFCERLAAAWEKWPDWRFGQLVLNVFSDMERAGTRPFYLEDDAMIGAIEAYCAKTRPKRSLPERTADFDGCLNLCAELLKEDEPSGDEAW